MRIIPVEKLTSLQKNPAQVRNVCILAHVDHGKTTLADSLVACNGIISERMAGKLRYMDSEQEEQERGITMKSSAIALYYVRNDIEYLVNLIDSPGHLDFYGEVSTAICLSDGAILVIDVVEGVCAQTTSALRLVWKEGIKPCLLLNKIDRLFTELKMTPMEAYRRLQFIVEQINAIAGQLFVSRVIGEQEFEDSIGDSNGALNVENEEESLYFIPERGNVIFASALDGWGFRVEDFATLWASRLGLDLPMLRSAMWGDFYFSAKARLVLPNAASCGRQPLFVQMVLDNLLAIYESVLLNQDDARVLKIVDALKLPGGVKPRELRSGDRRALLKSIFGRWLPLAVAVMDTVCDTLPAPSSMTEQRLQQMTCPQDRNRGATLSETFESTLLPSLLHCSAEDAAPTVAFVSKLFAVDSSLLSRQSPPMPEDSLDVKVGVGAGSKPEADADARLLINGIKRKLHFADETANRPLAVKTVYDEEMPLRPETAYTLLAFARVFSGTLRSNDSLYVILPERIYGEGILVPKKPTTNLEKRVIGQLYLMMGREFEPVDCVRAGNVVAIEGLEEFVFKTATLSSDARCPSLMSIGYHSEPIVRVSIEPKNLSDLPKLADALALLSKADPYVQTDVQDTGEHVLVTAGEMHLQRCLSDLQDRFAKIELNVSEPIVPFLETIVPPPRVDVVNEAVSASLKKYKVVTSISTANKAVVFRLRAIPVPDDVQLLLEKNKTLLQNMDTLLKMQARSTENHGNAGNNGYDRFAGSDFADAVVKFRTALNDTFLKIGKRWKNYVDSIWSFGPKKAPCNLLMNCIKDYTRPNLWTILLNDAGAESDHAAPEARLREYDQSVISGFQLFCRAGPLCDEPVRGVAFLIDEWVTEADVHDKTDVYGPLSGQIIRSVKEGCKLAFQTQPQRLMVAMYTCTIQATADVLGKIYTVLSRRCGKILDETLKEGTNLFEIVATLPVAESFGFPDEVRRRTSGLASPQLVFSHWEVLPVDPFWVPSTEEELLHFGEKADFANRAQQYVNTVRKRKGLPVNEKIVEFAEKQRTLSKNV